MRNKKRKARFLGNKRGYSVGFAWVFGLVTLFGIGVMYIVFNQVFSAHLVPVIKNMNNSSIVNVDDATKEEVNAGIDKYMSYFHLMPFILFGVVVIFMIAAAIRKERDDEMY